MGESKAHSGAHREIKASFLFSSDSFAMFHRALEMATPQGMDTRRLRRTAVTYVALINCCGKGGEWQRALEIWHQMEEPFWHQMVCLLVWGHPKWRFNGEHDDQIQWILGTTPHDECMA